MDVRTEVFDTAEQAAEFYAAVSRELDTFGLASAGYSPGSTHVNLIDA